MTPADRVHAVEWYDTMYLGSVSGYLPPERVAHIVDMAMAWERNGINERVAWHSLMALIEREAATERQRRCERDTRL